MSVSSITTGVIHPIVPIYTNTWFLFSDFCDRIFTACSGAVWKGVTLAKRFDNSSHFCLSRGYTIGVRSGSCFNSATAHNNNMWIVLFCLFISVLFGSNFRLKLFIVVLIFLSVS